MYRDTDLFDYLVEVIQPKLILAHGKSVIDHLSKKYNKEFKKGVFSKINHDGHEIDIRVENHFSYQWSYNKIIALASEVRGRYAS